MDQKIVVEDLSFQFAGAKEKLFSRVTFTLYPGSLYTLNGGNGVGKSTLLKLLDGEDPPLGQVSGKIVIDGVARTLGRPSQEIALVDQNFDELLVDHFTFEENLAFATYSKRPKFLAFAKKRKEEEVWRERLNIDSNRPVGTLSGGQRQMLAVLMMMSKHPKVLLLDEVTSALDAKNASFAIELIQEYAKQHKIAVLLVSHDHELLQEHNVHSCVAL